MAAAHSTAIRDSFNHEVRRIAAVKAAMVPQPAVKQMVLNQLPAELHRAFQLEIVGDPYFLRAQAQFWSPGLPPVRKLIHVTQLQPVPWGDRGRKIAARLADADVSYLCLVLPNYIKR